MSAIVLDSETTGFDPEKDRIIELSILPWRGSDEFIFNSRINPGRTIPPEVVKLTGIADHDVIDSPSMALVAEEICRIITGAEAVVGYNVAFDKRMISADLKRCGFEPTWPICICAKRIWDIYEPREERNLQNAYRRFVDQQGFDGAHGAPYDTSATRAVLRAQFDAFALHETPWDHLDPERRLWWGSTKHVIVVDGVLIMNFGKYESRPVDEVDNGFWSWVQTKDFPDHVTLLAMKMIEFSRNHRGSELRRVISEWGMMYREKMT